MPESTRGKRAWRQAAAHIEEYRSVYQVSDPERALGPILQEAAQRADWRRAQSAVERVHHKQRAAERDRDQRRVRLQAHRRSGGPAGTPEHQQQSPARARPGRDALGRQSPERAAG